jgi:pimeloyl-ACP methyl ester carboxylesterase
VTANSSGDFVRANGIDIHYVQAGEGDPLVLLHGGMVSTNPIWAPTPVSYAGHMATAASPASTSSPTT